MCGIFVSLGFEPRPELLDLVAHRGPDGRGWRVLNTPSGPLALGHRRLAIIDPTPAGQQPFQSACGRYALVFNGEIYNYRELRSDLERCGRVFRTQTDTEVLLQALIVWGTDALTRLQGMFAFVFHDRVEQTLIAARDRFGIKPLYHLVTSEGLAFASEIKQLLPLLRNGARMNLARVKDFLVYGMLDHTNETMFEGVQQLRPGEVAEAGCWSGARHGLAIDRWYPDEAFVLQRSEGEAAEEFRELLSNAVQSHMVSDAPVGACLSGGLDSSSIVCLAAGVQGNAAPPLRTFTAGYAEARVDETSYAKEVANAVGAREHHVRPNPHDLMAEADDLTWYQDEPFGSTSIFAQWSVFREARQSGVKVVLGGQGADEQLAGYHNGFAFALASMLRAADLGGARQLLARGGAARQVAGLLPLVAPQALVGWLHQNRDIIFRHNWLGGGALDSGGSDTGLQTAARAAGFKPPRDIDGLCRVMTFSSNLQKLLHWEDRSSMAHGVEARVPFLDHRLVEFSLSLGNAHKIVDGQTKSVLRKAMDGILPERVRTRQDKLGFTTPEQEWFRGCLRGEIEDGIEATLRTAPDLLNAKGVRALASDMLDGRAQFDFLLWRVVSLGLWARRFNVSV